MPIFEYEGKKYNVQDQHVSQFAKDFPDATSILERDGKKYRVKSADFGSFMEESQPQQQETQSAMSTTPDNEEYITGFGQGVKQGTQQLAAGVKYAGGEALDLITKTAKDNASALAALDKMQAEGKDVAQETKRDAKSILLPLVGHSAPAIDMVARVFGKKNPIAKANAEVANDKIIRKALEETNGDVEAARALLEQRANEQTTADEWRDEAAQVMNEAKPTKGAGAWVGNMIPQMAGTVAGLGLSAITKSPLPAQILGLGQMGALTASTAGASMKEARDAGVTNGEVWATGLADAAIEFATEAIPFKGYLSPLVNQMKSKTAKVIAEAVADAKSPARKELQDLLEKANEKLGGKLFTVGNAAKYMDNVLKEGASEFTAEALQTMTPLIYEDRELYPLLWEALGNGLEGLKGGIFMGSVLGGVSNAATNKAQRDRRKEQGFVNVAEVKVSEDSDETTIAEVIDYDDQADRASILINGEIMPLENASKNVVNQEVFSFEEFDRGQVDMEHAESYDRGRNIATPQEKNDALNELEAQEANIRQRYGLDPDADVDEFMGGDPIAYAMNETDTELRSEILDYVNAKAVYDGMTDGINERIATTIEESDRLIDSHVNKDDNLIHTATLKGVDENSDRKVYIISGAFARNEDGTIDTTDLAEGASVIVKDATTGKSEFIDPRNLKDIAEAIDPAEEKQRAAETITNEIATKEEAEIAGTLAFVPNDIYTIADENGAEHTATIVADNQDGKVQVIIDNAQEPMLMPKEKVQQMADAYNIGRANAKIADKKAQSTIADSSSEETTPMVENVEPKKEVPVLKNGQPDFNAMDAEMFVNEYASRYGEESATKIARKNISSAREEIAKIDKKIDDITDPNQMQGLFDKKAEAEARLNRYVDILDRMGMSEDANETEADQKTKLRNEAGNKIVSLFPDGLPNVESFILADIATGNRVRWSDKETNGAVTSRGLGAELGLSGSNKERVKRLALISNDAMTPEEYAESLRERLDAAGIRYDETALRDDVINTYASVDTRKGAWEALENIANRANEQEQELMDWEDAQQRIAYEKAKNAVELPAVPDLATIEEEVPEVPVELGASFDENINEIENIFNDERSTENTDVPTSVSAEDGIADGDQTSIEMVQSTGTDNTLGDSGSSEEQGSNEGNVGEGIADVPSADVFRAEEVDAATPQLSAKEEMRRKPLRARAKMWEAKVGVKVNLIERYEDITSVNAVNQIDIANERKQFVGGWYENGQVYIYLPHTINKSELDKTYIHEVVAHHGMKELLTEKGYEEFCLRVWDEVMSEEDRNKFINYAEVKGNKAKAADEYIARLSEDVDFKPSIWQKIARIFRSAVQQVLGEKVNLKQEDIIDLLRDSYTNLATTSMTDAAAKSGKSLISFNVKTEEELQQKIRDFSKTREGKRTGWTAKQVESIIEESNALINALDKALRGNDFYEVFADREPTIRVDWRDGEAKPTVTWTRANIEYKYDMSGDLLCVNNEGIESVLTSPEMVEIMKALPVQTEFDKAKNKSYDISMISQDYLDLYDVLRDRGFVVPCKGCFDAAVRFKMLPSVAQKFASDVNDIVDERNKNPEKFDAELRAKAGAVTTIDGLPATAKTKRDAIKLGVAGDNLTEHIDWTDLISAEGQGKILANNGGIFRAWQKTGAGRPKDKMLPEPYYGDIVSQTSTIIGKYGEKTPSFRDTYVNQGTGLRRNSHSEFRPVLAVDEIQFLRDAFIRNLTVFKYLKELDDVRLTREMGVKSNMSFFPEHVKGTKVSGLDIDGNYIASEESVGAREFPYIGEDGKTHYDGMKGWEEAQKLANKDASLSSVVFSIPHLIKALTDVPTPSNKEGIWGSLIPFHSSGATTTQLAAQGLGIARANGVGHGFDEAFYDYGKGVTNFEDVQNDRFGDGWVIIDGKKAGQEVAYGHKIEFANGTHYYNAALGVHLFSNGYVLDSEMSEEDRGNISTEDMKVKYRHPFVVDYNDKVREIGTPYAYKEAADYYINMLPTLGLIPRFSFEVPSDVFLQMCADANVDPNHPKLGWKGEGDAWNPIDAESYYSLFCDYGMTDPATGEWSPHRPVGYVNENGEREFRLPDNTIEIVKSGLDRYTNIRKKEEGMLGDAIKAFADKMVERGRLTEAQVEEILPTTSFRFIGEVGASNLDKAEEATTRLDNLAIAREMEAADKSAMTIKMATGWERGADGKWRYEVNDNITAKHIRSMKGAGAKKILEARSKRMSDLDKFTFIVRVVGADRLYDDKKILATSWPEAQKQNWLDAYELYKNDREGAIEDIRKANAEYRKLQNLGKGEFILYEVLGNDHDLFKEYPQLRNVNVVLKPYKGGGNRGNYNRLTNTITIIDFRGIMENDKGEGSADTLVHEIQHIIQSIEGFARGGNTMMDDPQKVKTKEAEVAYQNEMFEDAVKERNDLSKQMRLLNQEMMSWWDNNPDATWEDALADEKMFNLNKQYSDVEKQMEEVNKRVELYESALESAEGIDTSLGLEGYKRLAGEVEARNVERRRNMSLGERRNSPAWRTEDVTRKDQIFIEDALGEANTQFRVLDTTKAELKDKPIKLNGMYRFKLKSAFKGVKGAEGAYPFLKVQLTEVSDSYDGKKVDFRNVTEGFGEIFIPKGLITKGEKDNEFFIDPKLIEDELWEVLNRAENYYEWGYGDMTRFRISDYDRQFDALQSEYDALDKNDEKALNEWREKKTSAVRDYLTHIKDRFGMRSELIVFNGADEEQMREAYTKIVASYKAKSNANPPTYEDFKKKSLRKDMVAMYRKNGDTITFNATADDLNDKMQFAETMFHEDAHRVSYGLYTSDEFETIWKDAKKSKDRVAKVVDRLYGDKNDATKGGEYIAKAVGYLANKQKDSFMQFMRGEMPVDELLKKLRSNSKIAKLAVEETLNVIKDEYRVQVSRRGETRGMGGVGYGSGLQDTGVVLQGNGGTEQGGSADRDSRYRVRVLDSTLADMVGEEPYNKFLDGVFRDADDSIRREMVNRAMQNGLDFRTATQEYLANLVNENVDNIFLSEVKDLYVGTLEDAGIDMGDISDNELRYALWKNNQKDNGIFSLAEDVVMRSKLGVGNYRTPASDTQFRVADITYDNFFNYTKATFNEIEKPSREADYISDSGSEYWYGEDKGGQYVVRGSNHWSGIGRDQSDLNRGRTFAERNGRNTLIGSCQWELISNKTSKELRDSYPTPIYGKVYLKDMKPRFDNTQTDAPSNEREQIIADAKANGTYLKAPNGKDTNLTPDQWVTVRTDAFKKWFGDWENDPANASQIVDANGEPKVVYHRTPNEFTIFDTEKIGASTDWGAFGMGFYFSPNSEQYGLYGNNKMALFLDARNPLMLDDSNAYDVKEPFFKNYSWNKQASEEFTKWVKDNGYDAVVYKTAWEEEDIIFNPSQIKSAEGNTTFDANNDDIRFRVAPSTPSTGKARQMYDEAVRSHTKKNNVKKSENLWHHLREAYQDSMLSVQKLMDAVLAETGNTLRSSDDVYKAENQLSSKNKAEIEKWERDFMKPLQIEILDLIKKGASYDDIVEYLLAKHGLERNLEFSRREDEEDGKVWDGFVKRDFSGLTELTGEAEHFTEAAQQIVEEFEGKYDTDNLWSKINAATKESLKKSYDSGLMSKETYNKVANMFQYYIPLRGWDNNVAADQYEYMANKGMKILPALKTAKGRTSRADDPIATLGSVGESSIIQGNRNLMKQKFLNFAQNNPTSLLTVDEQWYEQNADGTWKPSNPEIPTDATADEVDAIIKAHEAKMEALGDKATKKRQGLNINLHTTKWEEEEHAVNVKRNGKEYKIYVNGNPIAAQAINGFTNPNANKKDSWEWIEQRATAVKNFMARAFTSMNPAFVLSNLARDIIWAGTSVAIKENADYARQYSKNISKAMTSFQLPSLVSKWKKGTLDMNDPIEKYFHEFITNGGETGFTQLNTVDDYKRNMERFIKEAQGGVTTKAKKGWRWIWDNVEFLNRSAEDTTRFMVYLTSRQMGRPISESIANAKDITVNFNKKGRGTMGANVLGFAYIFFNATIQSLANFGKLIANHPKKTVAALTTFGASGMITPMVALALQAMLSGDDDEPTYWDLPEWVRRNNIVIYVGGSGYVTIPLPHELRPFYGMGELAFSTLMGKEEPEVALQKAVEGFAGLMPFDFTGNAGNAIVNFTPTIAQPLVQLAVNKDYFGTPIYRKTAFNEQDPEWTKAYKSTNQLLVDATEFLNELTGGDEVKNGLIDLNPAVIEHLYEGYLGGMGKTINRAAKTFSMLWDEDARTWRNVPVASSFYQVSDERTSGSQVNREYFDAVDEADAIEHLYSGYRKRAKMGVEEYAEKLNELIESDAFKRYQKVNSYKKAIAKMNTILKEADPTDREDIETRIMELKVDMLEELDAMDIK